jgi:hypothetical protein
MGYHSDTANPRGGAKANPRGAPLPPGQPGFAVAGDEDLVSLQNFDSRPSPGSDRHGILEACHGRFVQANLVVCEPK